MATIQSLKVDNCKTFEDLGNTYVDGLVKCFDTADSVVEVYDRYDDPNSVKGSERLR